MFKTCHNQQNFEDYKYSQMSTESFRNHRHHRDRNDERWTLDGCGFITTFDLFGSLVMFCQIIVANIWGNYFSVVTSSSHSIMLTISVSIYYCYKWLCA